MQFSNCVGLCVFPVKTHKLPLCVCVCVCVVVWQVALFNPRWVHTAPIRWTDVSIFLISKLSLQDEVFMYIFWIRTTVLDPPPPHTHTHTLSLNHSPNHPPTHSEIQTGEGLNSSVELRNGMGGGGGGGGG